MNTQTTTQTTTETTPIKKCRDRSYIEAFTDLFTGKKCEKEGVTANTDKPDPPKIKIDTKRSNGTEQSSSSLNPPVAGTTATGAAAATTNVPQKAGGWFSRGGKRKSKAKKSRRKNRKQRKSRKSRK